MSPGQPKTNRTSIPIFLLGNPTTVLHLLDNQINRTSIPLFLLDNQGLYFIFCPLNNQINRIPITSFS